MSDDPSAVPFTGTAASAWPERRPEAEADPTPELTPEPAAEPVAEPDSEPVADAVAEPAPAGRRPLGVLITLGVVVLALLVGVGWGGKAWLDRRSAADNERAGVAVGRQEALNVFSFDYRTVESQLDVIKKAAGGRFAAEFTNSRAALIKVVKAEERVSNSRVVEVGVVTSSARSLQMIVALNEFRVTKANPKGVPILQRVFLELRKTGGHWKLVDLRPVA